MTGPKAWIRAGKLILSFWTSKKLRQYPHELLKCKLYNYGIGRKTLKWIDSFLCDRQQRVVVNVDESDWSPILSGVPQATVLGPLLFSLYVNDITEDINSELRLCADDRVCYREIKYSEYMLLHKKLCQKPLTAVY